MKEYIKDEQKTKFQKHGKLRRWPYTPISLSYEVSGSLLNVSAILHSNIHMSLYSISGFYVLHYTCLFCHPLLHFSTIFAAHIVGLGPVSTLRQSEREVQLQRREKVHVLAPFSEEVHEKESQMKKNPR